MIKTHNQLKVGDILCFPAFPKSSLSICREPSEWKIRKFNEDGTLMVEGIGGLCIQKLEQYEVKEMP